MKNSLILVVAFLAILTACSKAPVKSVGPMQTYAIVPFEVNIQKNLQIKKTTPEMLKSQEKIESIQYQNAAFQYLMSRKKEYAVNFQDVDDTNTLLKRGSVDHGTMTKTELCKLLGVDGILVGKYQRVENLDKNISKGLSFVASKTNLSGLNQKQGEASLSLSLYDFKDQKVIWTYMDDDFSTSESSPDELIKGLMSRASRKFPFKHL